MKNKELVFASERKLRPSAERSGKPSAAERRAQRKAERSGHNQRNSTPQKLQK